MKLTPPTTQFPLSEKFYVFSFPMQGPLYHQNEEPKAVKPSLLGHLQAEKASWVSAGMPITPAPRMVLRVMPKGGQSWCPKVDGWKGKSLDIRVSAWALLSLERITRPPTPC